MAKDTIKQQSITVGRMPEIGDVIGSNFRLDDVMARGGMGVIVRATQMSLDRKVAVKLLRPDFNGDEDRIGRFEREVHVAKDLNHPNVIQIYDFGQAEGGALYIVMEYLEGEDLQHLVNREAPLTMGRTMDITTQMLDGLGAAHDRGVVHRDLKPSNIFLIQDRRGNDQAKVLDFGIAKSLEGGSTLTKTGVLCGTPMYMPPEAVFMSSPGKPGDVYSVGLLILEMLMGRRVFDAGDMQQTIMMQMQRPVPIPAPIAETPLGPILRKAVRKHPDDRYPDADAFLEAIESVTDELPPELQLDPESITHDQGSFNPQQFEFDAGMNAGMDYLRKQESHRSSDAIPNPARTPAPGQTGGTGEEAPGGDYLGPEAPTIAQPAFPEQTPPPTPETPESAGTPPARQQGQQRRAERSDSTTADAVDSNDEFGQSHQQGRDSTIQWGAIGLAGIAILGTVGYLTIPGNSSSGDRSPTATEQAGADRMAAAEEARQPKKTAQKPAVAPDVTVSLNSEPSGATVLLGDQQLGTTPYDLTLPKNARQDVTLEHDGHVSRTLTVNPTDKRTYTIELTAEKVDDPAPDESEPSPSERPRKPVRPSKETEDPAKQPAPAEEKQPSIGTAQEPPAQEASPPNAGKPDQPADRADQSGQANQTEQSEDADASSDDGNLDDFLENQKLD